MTEEFDHVFAAWDNYVSTYASKQKNSDGFYYCEQECLLDLDTLIGDCLITDDMVPRILCVTFVNGDVFYYDFGQCMCNEEDCNECQCIGRSDARLQSMIVQISVLAVVDHCKVLSVDEKSLVTTLYHPEDLNDHITKHQNLQTKFVVAAPPTEPVVFDDQVFMLE